MEESKLFTEIKLDEKTLPKDNQWVEFETYEEKELVGCWDKEENQFTCNPKQWYSGYDVFKWKPLEIDWAWDGKEGTFENYGNGYCRNLTGKDKFGNEYYAVGVFCFDELKEVQEINSADWDKTQESIYDSLNKKEDEEIAKEEANGM